MTAFFLNRSVMSLSASQFQVRWYDAHHPLIQLPGYLKPWLLAEGSLTRQLTQYAHGQFHVAPFFEGFTRVYRHESAFLQMPADQRAWVRQVHLFGNQQQPWVKARSIIPIHSLQGQGRRLKFLGSRSLGSILFARTPPKCTRQIARLPEGWARRSLYIWHHQPLIVQEVFLDAFCQTLKEQSPQNSSPQNQ